MKQTARIISTYSADVFGVCSALYELGGMTIMHDASGCNSTYTTHDEPRWYDMESMIYISALSEMEAVMGDDAKLVDDIEAAARDLHPAFIAVAGTPIPTMTGFDFAGTAALIERRTGIPTFGFPTTGMNTYVHGASMALAGWAERFVNEPENAGAGGAQIAVNLLGVTPLDFSVNGTDRSMRAFLEAEGFDVLSVWAMGSTPAQMARAGEAKVNLVVSAVGLGAAKVLRRRFGTPYVVCFPCGKALQREAALALREAAYTGEDLVCLGDGIRRLGDPAERKGAAGAAQTPAGPAPIAVIGEGVTSLGIAAAIEKETGQRADVLCATECDKGILRGGDKMTPDEDDIIPALTGRRVIIADPLYQPICPPEAKFIALPTEAFSGRIWRKDIPDLVSDFGCLAGKL